MATQTKIEMLEERSRKAAAALRAAKAKVQQKAKAELAAAHLSLGAELAERHGASSPGEVADLADRLNIVEKVVDPTNLFAGIGEGVAATAPVNHHEQHSGW